MSWKKKALVATAVVCAPLVLTGCGGGDESAGADEQVSITFSHWGGKETYTNIYRDRIEEFERQNPDISVDVITVADGYETKIQTMMVGGEAPDVIQLAEAAPQFASRGQLLDLTDFIADAGIDVEGNWGDAISQYQLDGNTYGLPDRGGPLILYYNVDLFDEAGLAHPDENWTVEDMQYALEALTIVEDGETVQWGGAWSSWIPNWGSPIKSNGGHFILDGEVAINSPESLEALEVFNEGYQNGFIVPFEELEGGGWTHFPRERAAMQITGFWDIATFSQLDDLNFNIAPMWQGAEATTWPFGSALTISSDSDHPEEAWRFIEFMTGYEAQSILGESMGDCPAHLEVLHSDAFLDRQVNGRDINLDAIAISSERVVIDELFQSIHFNEIAGAGSDLIQEMLLGRLTPQETLEQLESRMITIMEN